MSSKFFNNRDGNSLKVRLNDVLKNYPIKEIDFLIAYFRISGFKYIAPYLKDIEKARILIGINIDKISFEQIDLFSSEYIEKNIKESFESEQSRVISNSKYSSDVEVSLDILTKMLREKKLEVRISKDKNIHSKIYILREAGIVKDGKVSDYRGSVITGSSNLSANGLERNYEFNVELRDSDEIEFASLEFNELWSESVELDVDSVDSIVKKSYIQKVTPYQLYMKFLYEYFENRIEIDSELSSLLPKSYKRLSYQEDAVNDGINKLKKHNGFILADVVGLGKTITASWIIKRLLLDVAGEVLIVTPPTIEQEWRDTIDKFEITKLRNVEFITNGSLKKIDNPQRFEIIVVDESHKFKTQKSKMYIEFENICKTKFSNRDKKVILISATPLTNKPEDLASQIYLFQDRRNSTIDGYENLEEFFKEIDSEYKNIIKLERESFARDEIKSKITNMSKKLNSFISNLIVRRTRTNLESIKRYKKDLKSQKIIFPKSNLIEIEYDLDSDFELIYSQTIDILTQKLGYFRFKARNYLKPAQKKLLEENLQEGFIEKSSNALANLIKTLLIKRFESSLFAFKQTLKRQKESLERFIEMFEGNKIYISKNLNLSKYENIDELENDIENIKDIHIFEKDDFEDGFIDNLYSDLKTLENLSNEWSEITIDFKLNKLELELKINQNSKIVIFSESEDTVKYLEEKLDNKKILAIYSSNKLKQRETIKENFDANLDKKLQRDDYEIILTTDVLAEGINLHRANIIYNYDIPWNSTKLMQRIGRINRIGTTHSEIFIYNIKPHFTSNDIIKLDEKAFRKLQSFHDVLGEDSAIYTNDESVNKNIEFKIDESESFVNLELEFLEEIIEFKSKYPKEFEVVKKLPNKIRVQRRKRDTQKSVVFVKNESQRDFILVENSQREKIDFLQMAQILKVKRDIKAIYPMKEIHYQDVAIALENSFKLESKKVKLNKNDRKAINHLKSLGKAELISKSVYDILEKAIKDGAFSTLSSDILKLKEDNLKEIDTLVQKCSSLKVNVDKKSVKSNGNIILSETLL